MFPSIAGAVSTWFFSACSSAPELGQHLIILLASASVPLQVLLSCLLQMLLHFLVHLTCTAPKCSLQEAQMGVSSSRTCQ